MAAIASRVLFASFASRHFFTPRFTQTTVTQTVGAAYGAKQMQSTKSPTGVFTLGLWVCFSNTPLFCFSFTHFFFGLSATTPQDTAGSERYEAMSRIYYKSAKAALICYGLSLALFLCHRLCAITLCCLSQNTDMTFAPSFKKVRFWADELKKQEPNCAIFVVGTKCLSIPHTVFLCLFP